MLPTDHEMPYAGRGNIPYAYPAGARPLHLTAKGFHPRVNYEVPPWLSRSCCAPCSHTASMHVYGGRCEGQAVQVDMQTGARAGLDDVLPLTSQPLVQDFAGGIMVMTQEQLQALNGYGTHFWGWGREDDKCAPGACRLAGLRLWPGATRTPACGGHPGAPQRAAGCRPVPGAGPCRWLHCAGCTGCISQALLCVEPGLLCCISNEHVRRRVQSLACLAGALLLSRLSTVWRVAACACGWSARAGGPQSFPRCRTGGATSISTTPSTRRRPRCGTHRGRVHLSREGQRL